MRDLIYREILEYHPQMLSDFLSGGGRGGPGGYMYPSAVDNFRRQFDHLEAGESLPARPLPTPYAPKFACRPCLSLRGVTTTLKE